MTFYMQITLIFFKFSVEVTCGTTTSENNTYFTSSGTSGTLGECRVKFCRASDKICQVKF